MQAIEHDIPYLLGGAFHRLAFLAWGEPAKPPVVCVHGLSRNARDFDVLATALAEDFYVLCPDLPGRGRSGWLPEPGLYQPITYAQALSHLLAWIGRPVLWVGTSLGGICGMLAAAAPGTPLQRLVLNDIGPFVPKEALGRIVEYVCADVDFADLAEAEAYLRRVHGSFGRLTDTQWRHMAENSVRALPGGRLTLHYDPAMTVILRETPVQDADMWHFWERIDLPMLVLRGADSDLLLPETLARMSAKAATHVVAETGHAPAMMDDPTIAVVRDFLLGARLP
jgi:pimeloyl-ACP methyl ester carboxylesterase